MIPLYEVSKLYHDPIAEWIWDALIWSYVQPLFSFLGVKEGLHWHSVCYKKRIAIYEWLYVRIGSFTLMS